MERVRTDFLQKIQRAMSSLASYDLIVNMRVGSAAEARPAASGNAAGTAPAEADRLLTLRQGPPRSALHAADFHRGQIQLAGTRRAPACGQQSGQRLQPAADLTASPASARPI